MVYNKRMKVGIYYYEQAAQETDSIVLLEEALKKHGFAVSKFTELSAMPEIDVLVVLGGDGTILSVAAECGKRGVKIVGINYGHLGFLTEYDSMELLEVVALLQGNDCMEERRSVIDLSVDDRHYYALNEVVFQRQHGESTHRRVIGIRASIDGKVVDSYAADGLIVCTPTGSTAYSLSAGGAVMEPEIDAFMLTPVCAHSLRSRPVVYSDSRTLAVELTDPYYVADAYADGGRICSFTAEAKIRVRRAAFDVVFLTRAKNNFYDKLFYKLNQWSGG